MKRLVTGLSGLGTMLLPRREVLSLHAYESTQRAEPGRDGSALFYSGKTMKMEPGEERAGSRDFRGRIKAPFVDQDGIVSNVDPAILSHMNGIRYARTKDGNKLPKEIRPGRCIFCGRKLCTKKPLEMRAPDSSSPSLEVCFCKHKNFRGSFFLRDIRPSAQEWMGRYRREKRIICPQCASNKFVAIKEKAFAKNEAREVDLLYIMRAYSCQTCGCKAEYLFLTDGVEDFPISRKRHIFGKSPQT